ncbi:hypothetical protein CDAR_294871 [Caerostris darwini]|uniref:Uncharacterized protein n=1 Tax=Caerostris darwini TaxID=1538125 RepID=A0AAV4UKL6_9ARAC|nr:hypothetical protein CDAR_294871 [Caerostris darwini]
MPVLFGFDCRSRHSIRSSEMKSGPESAASRYSIFSLRLFHHSDKRHRFIKLLEDCSSANSNAMLSIRPMNCLARCLPPELILGSDGI